MIGLTSWIVLMPLFAGPVRIWVNSHPLAGQFVTIAMFAAAIGTVVPLTAGQPGTWHQMLFVSPEGREDNGSV
jgi:hypothetical protein